MKLRTFIGGFALGCATMLIAATTLPNIAPQDAQAPPGQEQMEQQWAEYMEKYGTPGEEHKELARRAGNWTVRMEHFFAPDAPPQVTEGEARFEMLFGDRFLASQYNMVMDGETFEGGGVTGYDRMKQQYQSAWIDNMSTAVMYTTGTEEDDAIIHTGEMPGPGGYMKHRSVERMPDDNTLIIEFYTAGPDGSEVMSMKITHTRVAE